MYVIKIYEKINFWVSLYEGEWLESIKLIPPNPCYSGFMLHTYRILKHRGQPTLSTNFTYILHVVVEVVVVVVVAVVVGANH